MTKVRIIGSGQFLNLAEPSMRLEALCSFGFRFRPALLTASSSAEVTFVLPEPQPAQVSILNTTKAP